ncbi:hypothetical protein ABEB36_014224 [Hypothenemus hampei]|uniref:Uncharacterized protein n=1 Tax=Hypothenemus hampei TaxID=57062 RepID=A0ABD1E4K6_HYPHA
MPGTYRRLKSHKLKNRLDNFSNKEPIIPLDEDEYIPDTLNTEVSDIENEPVTKINYTSDERDYEKKATESTTEPAVSSDSTFYTIRDDVIWSNVSQAKAQRICRNILKGRIGTVAVDPLYRVS